MYRMSQKGALYLLAPGIVWWNILLRVLIQFICNTGKSYDEVNTAQARFNTAIFWCSLFSVTYPFICVKCHQDSLTWYI